MKRTPLHMAAATGLPAVPVIAGVNEGAGDRLGYGEGDGLAQSREAPGLDANATAERGSRQRHRAPRATPRQRLAGLRGPQSEPHLRVPLPTRTADLATSSTARFTTPQRLQDRAPPGMNLAGARHISSTGTTRVDFPADVNGDTMMGNGQSMTLPWTAQRETRCLRDNSGRSTRLDTALLTTGCEGRRYGPGRPACPAASMLATSIYGLPAGGQSWSHFRRFARCSFSRAARFLRAALCASS